MSKSKELFTEWQEAESKETKKSFTDARKLSGEIQKLITPYRQASVEDQKNS